jgi:hypothetical protein
MDTTGPNWNHSFQVLQSKLLHISWGPCTTVPNCFHHSQIFQIANTWLLWNQFGAVVLLKCSWTEIAILGYFEIDLVLWSPWNTPKLRLQYLANAKLIWSCGPHEMFKSWDCNTWILWNRFGPVVPMKSTTVEMAILGSSKIQFGPVVPIKNEIQLILQYLSSLKLI